MVKAGLLVRPKRGAVTLTDRGREVLRQNPERIDSRLLEQFEEFREFKSRSRPAQPTRRTDGPAPEADEPPRERLEQAATEANAAVAEELLQRIRERDP